MSSGQDSNSLCYLSSISMLKRPSYDFHKTDALFME